MDCRSRVGLGNVAGDQLKAASDLGVPLVGVGLLYSQGYFRQAIGRDGAQQALYPYNDPGQWPITLGSTRLAARQAIESAWHSLHFGRVAIDTRSGWHHFSVPVALGGLPPVAVCVELYADPLPGQPPVRHEMTPLQQDGGVPCACTLRACRRCVMRVTIQRGSFLDSPASTCRRKHRTFSGNDSGVSPALGGRRRSLR